MFCFFDFARCGRLLALSTTTIAGQPLSPEHQPPQPQRPTALVGTGPADTIANGNTALADTASAVHLGIPTLESVADAVADAATACPATAGAVGAGCSSETGVDVVGRDGEASGRRPSIKAGAEDLVGLNPQQLIEQVLVAREAATHAAERADAAERAARRSFRGGRRGPDEAAGGENDAGSDRWGFFKRDGGSSGVGVGQAARGEVVEDPPPPDGAVEELLSRRLLASAVDDFSSAVGEFSEVSRIWLEEVCMLILRR